MPMSVMPALDELLDGVEEDGLVGDGHELLGVRVGEGAQAAALAAAEDQAFDGAVTAADPCGRPCALPCAVAVVVIPRFTVTAFASAGYCACQSSAFSSASARPIRRRMVEEVARARRRSMCTASAVSQVERPPRLRTNIRALRR